MVTLIVGGILYCGVVTLMVGGVLYWGVVTLIVGGVGAGSAASRTAVPLAKAITQRSPIAI